MTRPLEAPIGARFPVWLADLRAELARLAADAARYEAIHPGWQPLRLELDAWLRAADVILVEWETLRRYEPRGLRQHVDRAAIQAVLALPASRLKGDGLSAALLVQLVTTPPKERLR